MGIRGTIYSFFGLRELNKIALISTAEMQFVTTSKLLQQERPLKIVLSGKPPSIRSLQLQIALCTRYELRVYSLKDIDYMAFDFMLSAGKCKLGMLAIAPRCDNPFMEGGFGSAQLKKLLTPSAARGITVLELGC
jgi:hypothetical protein